MKVAVVYWSGTGNTAAMADAVAEGAKGAGAEVNECMCMDFDQGSVASYDALIFGAQCKGKGVSLAADSVICENAPDGDALDKCKALGAKLAG